MENEKELDFFKKIEPINTSEQKCGSLTDMVYEDNWMLDFEHRVGIQVSTATYLSGIFTIAGLFLILIFLSVTFKSGLGIVLSILISTFFFKVLLRFTPQIEDYETILNEKVKFKKCAQELESIINAFSKEHSIETDFYFSGHFNVALTVRCYYDNRWQELCFFSTKDTSDEPKNWIKKLENGLSNLKQKELASKTKEQLSYIKEKDILLWYKLIKNGTTEEINKQFINLSNKG